MSNVANITIDHTKVDSDLTDFPIFIDLSDLPDSFWNTVSNGGGDIRVYKEDGTTQLAREVVSCDTGAKTGEMHLNYDGTLSSSSDITIQVWANGSSSEPASDSTYGSENVWSDYEGVYHLENANDSTSNGSDGTVHGATSGATGQVGDCYDFDGSNDSIELPNRASLGNSFTMSAWINTTSPSAYQKIIHYRPTTSTDNDALRFQTINGNFQALVIDDSGSGSGGYKSYSSNTALSANTWYFFNIVWDGTNLDIFLNGSTDTPYDKHVDNSITIGTSTQIRAIGSHMDLADDFYDGKIDTVRLRKNALSATWISTEYNNQSSPSTFYTASEPVTENTSNFFQFF